VNDDLFGERLGHDLRRHADDIDTDLVAVSLAAGRRHQAHRRTAAAAGTVLGVAVLVAGAARGPQLMRDDDGTSPVLGAPTSQTASATAAEQTTVSQDDQTDPSASANSGTAVVCTSTNTEVSLETDPGKAGSIYRIVVKPIGGACTIKGFPGVAMMMGGTLVGAPADYVGARGTPITLNDSTSAEATVTLTKAKYLGERCKPTPAAAFQVYLPNERLTIALPLDEEACANADVHQMTVTAFHART